MAILAAISNHPTREKKGLHAMAARKRDGSLV
jgi:hypothetical protein